MNDPDKLIIDISVGEMKLHIETADFEKFRVVTTDEKEVKTTEFVTKMQVKTMLNTLLI